MALVYCALAFAASVFAANVTWSRNSESDIERYEVHLGTSPGTYTRTVNAGNQASVVVNDLQPGVTYYITVTAVNQAGLVSEPSAEISYQEPLAEQPLIPRSSWTLRYVDSEEGGNYAAVKAFDGDPATFWHTRWTGGSTGQPHEIQIDLGAVHPVQGFRYLPRQDNYLVGIIAGYEFHTSLDGVNWGTAAASGTFANNSSEKQVLFSNRNARYVRLVCLSDGAGGPDCSVAEINLLLGETIVTPVNQAPAAVSKSISLAEDGSAPVTLSGSDPDGGNLTFAVVSGPAKGSLTGTPPNLTYTPAANFFGSDSFTYKANDGSLDSANATVSITVTAVNDAPVAVSKSITTSEDAPVSVVLSASDVEGSSLTYSIVSGPAKGALSGTAPNLTYTPNANFNGSDTFTYRASDGSANSNTATVSLTITPLNDPPVAASQAVTTRGTKPVSIVLSATDLESSTLTYVIESPPSNGTLAGTPPNLTYTAAAGFSGADSFTFKASDGRAYSNTATVAITVSPGSNAGDVISNSGWTLHFTDSEEAPGYQAIRAFDGDPETFWHTRFTSNATALPHEIQIKLGGLYELTGFRYLPRQDSLLVGNIGTFEFHTSMDGLTWSLAASGGFANDHDLKEIQFPARNARFVRLVSLTEANGSMHTSVAELDLLGMVVSNTSPSAKDLAFACNAGSSCTVILGGTDPDGDPVSHSILQAPAHGTLAGSGSALIYQPVAGFTGEDSFVYAASDGFLSAQATVIIRVSGKPGGGNRPPVFKMDPIRGAAAIEKRKYDGLSLDEIASDSDAGDVIRFSKTSGPEWLKVSASGKLSGTPPSGAGGIHRFKVTATDKAGAAADAELIVEIQSELPLPWDIEALGSAKNGDAVREASGTLALTGSGDLTGPSDAGTFVWQKLSGDGQVVARVTSLDEAGAATRAGVMIRDSLAPKSSHAFLGVNGGGDFRWIFRTKAGKPSKLRETGKGSPPATWLKLVREGDKITAFRSRDGDDWTRVGSATVDLGKTCYIGLIVSGGGNKPSTACFRDVRIKP